MLKHIVIAILATLTAIAIVAFAWRGERPIVYVGGSLSNGAQPAAMPAWPPLPPPLVSRPATVPTAGASPFVRTYNVRDIIIDVLRFSRDMETAKPPSPELRDAFSASASEEGIAERLKVLIIGGVDPQSWVQNGGAAGHIHYFGGLFVVEQRHDNHAKIEQLLDTLRRRP